MSSDPHYEALLKAGDLERARREAEAAYQRDASDRRALLVLARLAVFDGQDARAESLLAMAVRVGPGEDVETLLVRAALLTQRGERNAALELYREMSQFAPPRAEAFFGMGYVLAELGEPFPAREALARAVTLDPDVALTHFHLARVLFTLHRFEEAFRHLEQSLRLNPWHAPSYLVFARALQAGGELEAAENLLRQGQKAVPDDRGLLNALSDVRLARGNVRGAVSAAEALVRVEPDGAAALGNLARLRVTERRFREALELCRQLEARGMSTSLSRSVEALVCEAQTPPDLAGALAAWREAMRLAPEDWMPAFRLGAVLLRVPDAVLPDATAQAREALEEARLRDPDRPEPLLPLAVANARLGEKARARSLAEALLRRSDVETGPRAQAEQLLRDLGGDGS